MCQTLALKMLQWKKDIKFLLSNILYSSKRNKEAKYTHLSCGGKCYGKEQRCVIGWRVMEEVCKG